MRDDVKLSLKNGISIINGLHSILNEDEELQKPHFILRVKSFMVFINLKITLEKKIPVT